MPTTIEITEEDNEAIRVAFDTFQMIFEKYGIADLHSKLHSIGAHIEARNEPSETFY